MPLKPKIDFLELPKDWSSVGGKNTQDAIVGNLISSYFYKHISNLYDELLKKSSVNSHRVPLSVFFTSSKTLQDKVRAYKNEGAFLNFINQEFDKMLFFSNHMSCNNTDLKKSIGYYTNRLLSANKKYVKDVWLNVAKDVKNNIPFAYNRFLEIFLNLYLNCLSIKDKELCKDLWTVIPAVKSKEADMLKLLKLTDLENQDLRGLVLKKIVQAQNKNASLISLKKYLKSKPAYEEFKDFLDLYKNFDNGFTDSLVTTNLDVMNLKIPLKSMLKTFPILTHDKNNYKRYNDLMDIVLVMLFSKFNIEVYFNKKYGKDDIFGNSDEYSLILKKESTIQGVPLVELLEEIFLFTVSEINENGLSLVENYNEIINRVEIQVKELVLNLTIPQIENVGAKAIKW